VFGPNQDPHGVYAAAIPKFIEIMKRGGELTIHGDGEQTRDFTYVENAVTANLLALSTANTDAFGNVYNVACGSYYSLNAVIANIKELLVEKGTLHPDYKVIYGPERHGDIKDSLADIQLTRMHLGYENPISFMEGMKRYLSST
jgi:nucleoside-diphosphate-sugar epimerase